MKHTLSLLLIAYAILFNSCSNSNNNGDNTAINIEAVIGTGAIYNASYFIKDIKYIPLETISNSMVSGIKKVFVENEKIYVWDDKNIINVFDITGRHLNTLNRVGRGPEEYTDIADLNIEESGNIYVLSPNNRIIEYDNNLKFIRKLEFETNANFSDFILLGNGLFASNTTESNTEFGTNEQSWIIYDYHDSLRINFAYSSERTMSSFTGGTGINQSPVFFTRLYPFRHYKHNNDLIIYKQRINDTIFNIELENNYLKSARYIFNYGKYTFLEEMESSIDGAPDDLNAISLSSLLETNNYLFLDFDFRGLAPEPFEVERNYMVINGRRIAIREEIGTKVYAIYDKNKREIILLNQPSPRTLGLKDDIIYGAIFWPKSTTKNQELISWYNALDLVMLAEEGKIDQSVIGNLKEDDNPVIVIATPK